MWYRLGWPKSWFGFFCKMLWKYPNELFGQPNVYNGVLLNHKKERNNAICSNMDVPRDYHTKRRKSERERQIPYDVTYMWNLKDDTMEPIYETETESTDIENRLVVAKGEEIGGGMEWEVGVSKHKLLCIEWINNKVLLYSTKNYFNIL